MEDRIFVLFITESCESLGEFQLATCISSTNYCNLCLFLGRCSWILYFLCNFLSKNTLKSSQLDIFHLIQHHQLLSLYKRPQKPPRQYLMLMYNRTLRLLQDLSSKRPAITKYRRNHIDKSQRKWIDFIVYFS